MKNSIINDLIIILFCCLGLVVFTAVDCYQRYPYIVSSKIMELSNVEEQAEIIEKKLDRSCWHMGPEKLAYPEKIDRLDYTKTYMLDYNYYIVVEFKSNCDLGDSVGFYKKYAQSCDNYWGCGISDEYTYRAKVYKSQFKISLLDLIW